MSERKKMEGAKRASNRAVKHVGQANTHQNSRTYTDPDVWTLPNNPKRWRYVLGLLIKRYNDRHSIKHKRALSNSEWPSYAACGLIRKKFSLPAMRKITVRIVEKRP